MLSWGKESDELKKKISEKISSKGGMEDTLPELIVLMLTNGQKREMIEKTLEAFFDGDYIKEFMDWLYGVIEGKEPKKEEKGSGIGLDSIVPPPPPPEIIIKKEKIEEEEKESWSETEVKKENVTGKKRKREHSENKVEKGELEFEKKPKKIKIEGKSEEDEGEGKSRVVDLTKRSSRFDFLSQPLRSGRRKHANLSWRRTDN